MSLNVHTAHSGKKGTFTQPIFVMSAFRRLYSYRFRTFSVSRCQGSSWGYRSTYRSPTILYACCLPV